jgi:hypothetical protein
MKTFALIARRADHTRDAFRAHYEDVHAPLAVETVMEGTTRYVRHHLREEWFGAPDFDVLTAFWYREIAAAVALMERVAGPAGERIRQDEESFMDRARNTFFPVTEHPVLGQEDRSAGLLALALVRGPEPDGREAFVSDYEARWVPRLLEAAREPVWCLQNRALAIGPEAPAFDCVTQLHAAGDAGLRDWAAEVAEGGAQVCLVGVSEHETETPWS